MTTPPDWPFDQAPDVAAISDAAVVADDAPILMVIHYSDDHSWTFLSGCEFDVATGKVIGMGIALRIDPSLREIADLAPGWIAVRDRVGGVWRCLADPVI